MSFALLNLAYSLGLLIGMLLMIEAGRRTAAVQMHPPTIIFVMLAGLMLICSLLAGYGMASGKSRNWVHTVAFAAILA